MSPDKTLEFIVEALEDAKGENLCVLDVREITSIADYMVVVSGNSDRHVKAMSSRVIDSLRENGVRPQGVEGEQDREWILIDYGDIVVHIMQQQTRDFYELEKLWSKEFSKFEVTRG